MRLKVGDIVVLWEAGVRRLVVDSRDEIVSVSKNRPTEYKLRTVYRIAGNEYSDHWFTERQISPIIPR